MGRVHSSHMYNMISVSGDAAHVESDEFFGTGVPWAPSAVSQPLAHPQLGAVPVRAGATEAHGANLASIELQRAVLAREALAQELIP